MHESFLKDVLDSTKVGIFLLDRTFQVIWINRAIEELFGIQKEEVIGKYKPSLIEHTLKNIFEDPEEFASRVIATYKQNDYVENFVCHILPGPGRKERWVEHWSQPIYEGMVAS